MCANRMSHTDQGERTVLKSRHMSFGLLARAVLVAGLAIAAAPAPAAAQNLFDFFFSGARRPSPPPMASAYADPQAEPNGARPSDQRLESGPAVSYCVRLCDGRFFPIQRSAATPVEVCNSFCPASRTKIFSGGSIDHAVAHDGSRYADLSNAFAYRNRIVPDCTCNGKDAFGLAPFDMSNDPTLRPGDIVSTKDGFVAYSGARGQGAAFTPIDSGSVSAQLNPRSTPVQLSRRIEAPLDEPGTIVPSQSLR